MDVNVGYSNAADFEFTQQLQLFDLLRTPLLHGWLPDPQEHPKACEIMKKVRYNQLAEQFVIHQVFC